MFASAEMPAVSVPDRNVSCTCAFVLQPSLPCAAVWVLGLQGLPSFEHDRAKTDRESTTMLSPWIHFGSISVRHIYYRQVARGVCVCLWHHMWCLVVLCVWQCCSSHNGLNGGCHIIICSHRQQGI